MTEEDEEAFRVGCGVVIAMIIMFALGICIGAMT